MEKILKIIFYSWILFYLIWGLFFLIKEKKTYYKMLLILITSNSISIVFWMISIISYILGVTFLPKAVFITLLIISIILLALLILFISVIRTVENVEPKLKVESKQE